jgi:hypothetical protein
MIRVSSVRFFLVVSPAPVWMRAAFVAAVMVGIATLWLNPAEIDSALGTILLLQMFSASNGYSGSAARGHFDPLLVGMRPMWRVAAGNVVAAALPGAVAWATILCVASALGHGAAAFAPQRQVAILIVSAVAWSVGVALPRMAGGSLWSLLILALALSRGALAESLLSVQSAPANAVQVLSAAGFSVICPFLLLGEFSALTSLTVIGLDLLTATCFVLAGCAYVCRRQLPLAEPA